MKHDRHRARRTGLPARPRRPSPPPRPRRHHRGELPPLSDRWAALPIHHRRALQALLAALATAALALPRPTPAAPTLGPPPSQVTSLRHDGPGTTINGGSATFLFTVSVRERTPVTLQHIGADLPGLATRTTPAPPLTVKAAEPQHRAVRISVRDCSTLPHGVNTPHLDLIPRTPQAQQPYSFLFGGSCPRDLSRLPHTAYPSQESNTV
ncbi:hypothetical protein ABZ612_01350 [Streptomyces avermitilis]|uniref:hypothetical protein n=1 Tax=Streptomyces avermitilis TaxID=33903 RepID=UPI0033DA730D